MLLRPTDAAALLPRVQSAVDEAIEMLKQVKIDMERKQKVRTSPAQGPRGTKSAA